MRPLILYSIPITFLTLLVPAQGFPRWNPYAQITNFYKCVNDTTQPGIKFNHGFYDPNFDPKSFTTILNSTAANLRCIAKNMQKPKAIFTPTTDAQVQAAVQCAAKHWLHVRIRSGGHDYEGLSYISYMNEPFVVLDMRKIRNVDIDVSSMTAWVDVGVTIGEFYYKIYEKSKTLAFPGGLCTDIGIGGHITGGAYGPLMRKYGLGVDNVINAKIVNAEGNILDKDGMGEDLFWAIRGGGGANFGVILRFMFKLVRVPEKVTVFAVQKFVNKGKKAGMEILQKWQSVSSTIDKDLFIRVIILNAGPNSVLTIYQGLYLGKPSDLLQVMANSFPELELARSDCIVMKWIDSMIFVAGFRPAIAPKDLLTPMNPNLDYFKAKSDFVGEPITEDGLKGMFDIFRENAATGAALMIWTPYGGKTAAVREDETPFPHRDVLFMIQYVANWFNDSAETQLKQEDWIRKLYGYMGGYVTQNPRQSYVNYRDLDIGKNYPWWNCSDPETWGPKYYKGNYKRLVEVKGKVDFWNLFYNEQSIPTMRIPYGFCTPFDNRRS